MRTAMSLPDAEHRGGLVLFAVLTGLVPAEMVPTRYHITIQDAVDAGRVDLNPTVPPEVLARHPRAEPVPPIPADLDADGRRRFVLDHLIGQIDAASSYLAIPHADLPGFVWAWLRDGQPVALCWHPGSGTPTRRVVQPVANCI
jgi:hypothetical protein